MMNIEDFLLNVRTCINTTLIDTMQDALQDLYDDNTITTDERKEIEFEMLDTYRRLVANIAKIIG